MSVQGQRVGVEVESLGCVQGGEGWWMVGVERERLVQGVVEVG